MPLAAGILFLLPMHLGRDFQAKTVQADEAGGVVLVVGLGRVGFHRGDVRVVEAHRGFAGSGGWCMRAESDAP